MNVLTHAIPVAEVPAHPLKLVALFFGVALAAFACLATYGLDLSPGFF